MWAFQRFKVYLKPRARTWAFMIPLHLVAFGVLYIATVRLLETEVVAIARRTASHRLESASLQLGQVAVAHTKDRELKHFFEAVLVRNREIHLQLLLPDGRRLGSRSAGEPVDPETLRSFVAGPQQQRFWVASDEDRDLLHGIQRVVAADACSRCHAPGETLAVASMNLELTEVLASLHGRSRRNIALLIVAWAAALGGSTAVVKASVRRSAKRLQEDLVAAVTGTASGREPRSRSLVLDPVTAELHDSLQDFLTRQRQREAEVANRLAHTDQLASLGRLAAGLAHEIKNPLAGIQGALEIMNEDTAENEPNKELYGEMLAELGRVNGTLQTLLGSARISPPRLATTDLRPLLEDLHRLMEPGLRRQGVTLKLEIAPGSLAAIVDGAKMRQVLINLIQNAAEAMEDGGEVVIRASNFPDEGGVILAVHDDGPGISEENQKRIFEPFFTTKFGGTGLGLAIAQSLVQQHGGTLEIQSGEEAGTTFYMLLPDRQPEAVEGD